MIRSKFPHLHVAALSHAGLSGKNNEDRYEVSSFQASEDDPRPSVLAVVADGIGGHKAGEIAAELAVNYITKRVADSAAKKPLKTLERAIHDASLAIAEHAKENEDQTGMGSTCACAWVIGNHLYTAYVGDSRIYLLREGQIQRLTIDHTWVQEAFEKGLIKKEQMYDHLNRHVIRRHLGGANLPDVDFRLRVDDSESNEESARNQGFRLEAGDIVLACSDGLTDLVWDDEINDMIRANKDINIAAEALVDLANRRGGYDNITVVLLAVPRSEADEQKKFGILDWIFGND
ncbi:MAG: protein phosphatase 2C domain-containing protein [Anaerolineales bacterium]|nr:protein phosphatase 2C domain-containing protein [Anaerolineales bacterium]